MATRLAPTVSPDTDFFWNGVRDHKLLIQRCAGCQALRQPSRPMCPACNSLDWDTIESNSSNIDLLGAPITVSLNGQIDEGGGGQ